MAISEILNQLRICIIIYINNNVSINAYIKSFMSLFIHFLNNNSFQKCPEKCHQTRLDYRVDYSKSSD